MKGGVYSTGGETGLEHRVKSEKTGNLCRGVDGEIDLNNIEKVRT